MSEQRPRVFDTAFKEALMVRLASGETLAGLSKETGIRRKSLYEWRNAYRRFGVAGLNRKRGRKPGGGKGANDLSGAGTASSDELAAARARIAELERTIGRQQVDLEFFRQALQLTDAPGTQVPIAPASTRSSKP